MSLHVFITIADSALPKENLVEILRFFSGLNMGDPYGSAIPIIFQMRMSCGRFIVV
jgi:hypothetical protein